MWHSVARIVEVIPLSKVLIIDDDYEVACVVRDVLEKNTYIADIAESAS